MVPACMSALFRRSMMLTALCLMLVPAVLRAEHIAPTDDRIQYLGRWVSRDGGMVAFWPASAIRFRMSGPTCSASIVTSGGDFLAIFVDGKATQKVKLGKPGEPLVIADKLGAGEHTIELIKATESFVGSLVFTGLDLPSGAQLLKPAPVTRRIEFIGDSITAGYGNEDPNRNHHFAPDTENAALTYAVFTARKLNADWTCVAVSGIWLMPGAKDQPMPKRYPRIDPWNEVPWDFSRNIPDAVVINLGTNDANQKPFDEKKYTESWTSFIADIRKNYPQAQIFCTIAPMGDHPMQDRCIQQAVSAANSAGDTKVHAVKLPSQDEKLDGIGADWHPTVKCHQRLAGILTPIVAKELNW